jgi:hypothetical protein
LVSEWGIVLQENPDKSFVFIPQLRCNDRTHPMSGLEVTDMQGLDDETILIVVKELSSRDAEHVLYALILDMRKLSPELVSTCKTAGYLQPPARGRPMTKSYIDQQWKWMREAQAKNEPTPALTTSHADEATPTPTQTSTRKRKTAAKLSSPASASKNEKGKKAKADANVLTIEKCINFTPVDLKKMGPKEVEAVGAMLNTSFTNLFITDNKVMTETHPITKEAVVKRIHFDRLHRAPKGIWVYRGIEPERLEDILNATRARSQATASISEIRVMPLKSKPLPGRVDFFMTKPTVQDCQKESTHFWIIGGQHTVEAHKILAKDLPSTWTMDEISHFPVIPVWAKPDKEGELNMLQYSRGLNQDLSGVRKEPCFTEQIATCRLKWDEYLRPSPKLVGGEQSAEFKVSLDQLKCIRS